MAENSNNSLSVHDDFLLKIKINGGGENKLMGPLSFLMSIYFVTPALTIVIWI